MINTVASITRSKIMITLGFTALPPFSLGKIQSKVLCYKHLIHNSKRSQYKNYDTY